MKERSVNLSSAFLLFLLVWTRLMCDHIFHLFLFLRAEREKLQWKKLEQTERRRGEKAGADLYLTLLNF